MLDFRPIVRAGATALLLTSPALAAPPLQDSSSPAESAPAGLGRTLRIGTKEAAPFSFRGPDGAWRGISVELWAQVAEDLGLEYEWIEAPLDDLIDGLTDGRFDASVAALTVTPAREARLDFGHAYHPSGLGIAVPAVEESDYLSVLANVFTLDFLKAVATLLVVLFLGGAVVWMFERKRNPEQFGGAPAEALGSAFWWSAVTMTTVGYGDKAPVTAAGRFIGVVWMFAGVITISGLTAAIASTLTVSRLEHAISGPDDLHGHGAIACVRGSTGASYLEEHGVRAQPYSDATAMLEAVAQGQSKAAVYDAPIMRYLARGSFAGRVTVLSALFERQDYAFALPLGSELRKPVNRALLERISAREWGGVLERYLGTAR